MNVLIIYAHHDANSFANAMLERALQSLNDEGHQTRVSDLYAMGFKAITDDADFSAPRPPGGPGSGTDYQNRQRQASKEDGYAPDILQEIAKLEWADAVIFLFPYYFFHFPAILKGWFDRVLVYDKFYSNDHPEIGDYGRGGLAGKRALLGVTFGAPRPPKGAGPSRHYERIEAIQSGALNYVGLDAMAPFVAWAVAHVSQEQRLAYLDEWEARVRGLFTEEPELFAADGPTPPPELLLGRLRRPGDKVRPYGGDKAIAGTVLVARLTAAEGKADELVRALEPFVAAAVPDRGTRVYTVLRSPERADEIWLIEAYDDLEARQRHAEAEPFRTIVDRIGNLLAEPPILTPLTPLLSKGI